MPGLALPEYKSIETQLFHPEVPRAGLGPGQKWQKIIDTEQCFFSLGRVFSLCLVPIKQQIREQNRNHPSLVSHCQQLRIHRANLCYLKRRGLEPALSMGHWGMSPLTARLSPAVLLSHHTSGDSSFPPCCLPLVPCHQH